MTVQQVHNPELRDCINKAGDTYRNEFQDTGWWHSIDLGNGYVTQGVRKLNDLQNRYAGFKLPHDLTGKRVLDIGCWDGFYSFEAERHGAEVVAVDCWRPEKFFVAHQALNSKVEFHELSVYEVTRNRLGTFDVVFFLGVLYHLQHPLLALQRVCEVTRDTAIIESHVIDNILSIPRPVMEYYEIDELAGQYDNWWGPNTDCLVRMARTAGFVSVEVLYQEPATTALKAQRNFAVPANLPANIQITAVFNASTYQQQYPRRGRHAQIQIWVDGLPPEATRENVWVKLGGLGASPFYLGPVNDPAVPPNLTKMNIQIPPGLELGAAKLQVFCNKRQSHEVEITIEEGTEW